MADINYEVLKKHGILSKSSRGWTKELRTIAWNNNAPKYDLREWAPDDEKMGKGITLSKDELEALKELLGGMDTN